MIEMGERLMEICKNLDMKNYTAPKLLTSSPKYLTDYLRIQKISLKDANSFSAVRRKLCAGDRVLEDAKAELKRKVY